MRLRTTKIDLLQVLVVAVCGEKFLSLQSGNGGRFFFKQVCIVGGGPAHRLACVVQQVVEPRQLLEHATREQLDTR